MKRTLSITLLMLGFSTQAKVLNSSDTGFSIQIEIEVNASKKQAYKSFLKVGNWWNSDHTWFGDAKALSIQPKVGGCFCEKNGKKQAMHMTVSYVDPNNEVRMIGGLGPLQMMGVHGGMSWKFEELEPNKTKITHSYSVTGYSANGLSDLAPVVDSVQNIQMQGLKNNINNNVK